MYTDLHVHSQYSDGTLTIKEIVTKAQSQDITLLSICDHNSIDAYLREGDFCAGTGITLVTGVEINCKMHGTEYHILAYGFDIQNTQLHDLFQYNYGIYTNRDNTLIENMSKDYPTLSMEEFMKYERDRKNGGWDSLDYIKSKGLANNWQDYHSHVHKYNTAPSRDFLHPVDVIKIIHNAGGYAVLAHLMTRLEQDTVKCEEAAMKFIGMGIDGFECYYPSHSDKIISVLLDICHRHDKIFTAGSDDHGGFNNIEGGCRYDMDVQKITASQLYLNGILDYACLQGQNSQKYGA